MARFNPQDFCPVGIGGTKYIDTRNLKLFVGNLPPDVTSQKLFDFFKVFGSIREAVIIPDRFRIRSRGYGFVTFVHESDVKKVFTQANLSMGTHLLNITLAYTGEQPRRAHFTVKHGHNGHKLLKEVSPRRRFCPRTDNLTHDNSCMYRTANIQAIDAVREERMRELELEWDMETNGNVELSTEPFVVHCGTSSKPEISFPNKDIEKDFKVLCGINFKALKSDEENLVNVIQRSQSCAPPTITHLQASPASFGHNRSNTSPFLDLRKIHRGKKNQLQQIKKRNHTLSSI